VSQVSSVYDQILDFSNRANPYPLYAELRKTPVTREADGSCVVSTYREILALLHDPRISADPRSLREDSSLRDDPASSRAFIRTDPPEHDRLRRQAMRHFGPPHHPERIDGLRPWLSEVMTGLIDTLEGKNRVDIVDDLAYPLPVTVICKLLGVPREDEPRFSQWVEPVVQGLDPRFAGDPEYRRRFDHISVEFNQYLAELIDLHRRQPGDDILSGLVSDPGPDRPMSDEQLVGTARLLLIAGHETTVNLITNGVLTLLRHPDVLERVRSEPELVVGTVEELLRYEPPVQIAPFHAALDDIHIGGATIERGSPVMFVLAAGNRDPSRFEDPDRFDPEREDNQHLGFFSGIHYCFGAPLARVETQIALTEIIRRLEEPRLVVDPPPYRDSPVLRGPRHLLVDFDRITA
jgi:cytochrome P450